MKKITFLTIVSIIIFSSLVRSQSILEYERTTFSGTYQQIVGTPGPQGLDDAKNYNLPFMFKYINHIYNKVRISTKGRIELGSATRPLSSSISWSNENLFSFIEPNKTIAAWWDDLAAYNNPVEYTTLGSTPNRIFVVQWKDVNSPFYSQRSINFQIRLYETSNLIEFWYGNVSGSGEIEYASFGIEDEIGGSGHFIDGPTGSNTVGTTNLNCYDNWPILFYRFKPLPVKVVYPNGGEFLSIGYPDTIKWVSTVNNIKLEYSTDSGNNWSIIENSLPAAAGRYTWTVPNTPSENALVRISDAANNLVLDISDNVFTISAPPVITVLPDSFSFVLNEGDSTESVMQISNSGLGNLFYEISIENLSYQFKGLSRSLYTVSSTAWKESFLKAQEHHDIKSRRKITGNKLTELVLPLIISDSAGDGGPVDIIQIRGRSTADSVQIELIFGTVLDPLNFGGAIGLDIDQDFSTGVPLPFGLPEQQVGCEYYIYIFSIASNLVNLYDQFNNFIGSFPAHYELKSIGFSIPKSSLGNDDGIINLAAVVGSGSGPTDWIPHEGYGVLGGNLWLNIEPLSGVVSAGDSASITLRINTDNIDGGEYHASLLISSNDPLNRSVTIPMHLTVIGQPDLVAPDSLNFGQTYVGYPEIVTAELKNNGSVSLVVSNIQTSNPRFTILGNTNFNIEPLGTHQLSVSFSPLASGIENGTLSIISNDPSSPGIINLSGNGVFPPVITVSPDSFYYNLNVGDSVTTQLTIDNSNGLGELIFQISDKLIAGRKVKNSRSNYIKQKNISSSNINFLGIDPTSFSKLNTQKKFSSKIENDLDPNNPSMSLPLIVSDIIGDGGIADIKEIRGHIFNNNFEIEYVFADGINISDSLIAVMYLDIDRDSTTGKTNPFYYHDLGVDYFVDYYPILFGNEIVIIDTAGNQFSVPYSINGTTLSYSVPLSILGNDDGEMDLLTVSGYYNLDALDWAPDEGHKTLFGDVSWLNENPSSGVIPPGGNMTIEIRANTSELIGGNYLAAIGIQSNDPAYPITEIPFALRLTGIPQISVSHDSLNFGKTYIGYYNSLSFTISNSGTDSLFGNILSSDPRFILSDSVFALPVGELKSIEVQFHPSAVGNISAQLKINSNATTIPKTVDLKGEGVIAPNITTNHSILEFEAAAGDTISSNFVIYNTGGSDLFVEISDEVANRSSSG